MLGDFNHLRVERSLLFNFYLTGHLKVFCNRKQARGHKTSFVEVGVYSKGSILGGRTFRFHVSEHVSEKVMIGFGDEGRLSLPEETAQTFILVVFCRPVKENLRVVLEYFVFVEFDLLHVGKSKSVEPLSVGANPIVESPRR